MPCWTSMGRRNSLESEQLGHSDHLHNKSLFLCHKPDFFFIKRSIMYSRPYTCTFHIENPHEYIQKVKLFNNSLIFEKNGQYTGLVKWWLSVSGNLKNSGKSFLLSQKIPHTDVGKHILWGPFFCSTLSFLWYPLFKCKCSWKSKY